MSATKRKDATAPITTEMLWSNLDEVLKRLAVFPDAKTLFNKHTVMRTVVGEVAPVYTDGRKVREVVFQREQNVEMSREIDGQDAVCIHILAYLNYTTLTRELEERMRQEQLKKSIGMEGVPLRFQPRSKSFSFDESTGESGVGVGGRPYRPDTLIPVGTTRMQRMSRCPRLGPLPYMVARVERVCVIKSVRCYDVGKRMMEVSDTIAMDVFHVQWALLHARSDAIGFYTKMGYSVKEVGSGGLPKDNIAVMMKYVAGSHV